MSRLFGLLVVLASLAGCPRDGVECTCGGEVASDGRALLRHARGVDHADCEERCLAPLMAAPR